MKVRAAIASLLLISAAGCKSNSSTTNTITNTPVSATRSYNGDFLTIDLDSTAHTLTYSNHSNGDAGTVPYTVNTDGTYTLNDPAGNLIAAYEIPNYALLIQAAKTGPDHNTKALITAVQSSPITISTLESHNYNYMQFRTNSGGFEAGSVKIDAQGNIAISSYSPFGAQNQGDSPFKQWWIPGQQLSGRFVRRFSDARRRPGLLRFRFRHAERNFRCGHRERRNPRPPARHHQRLQPDFRGQLQSDLLPEDQRHHGPGQH